MGTLAELKARILDEMPPGAAVSVRQIGQHVARAIEHYAAERFHFNVSGGPGLAVCSPGAGSILVPEGLRTEDIVQIVQTGSNIVLEKLARHDMEALRLSTNGVGRPEYYSWRAGGAMYLHPTPDAAYTIAAQGVYDLEPLANDAASNAWTTEAADLIAARAVMTIFRDLIGDIPRAQAARGAEEDALYSLRAETVRRLNTGQMRPA